MAGSLLSASLLCNAAHAAEAFSPNSKWMLGDWGGKRTELLEKGYDFKLEYVGEAAANLDGGYDDDKTGRYTDQFALGVHMDLEKILGWKAAEFQFTVTERNGKNLSNDRIGDPRAGHISSVQEVWGRGQTWRLTQLWLKQQYFDGALDVKFGRFGGARTSTASPAISRTWPSAARRWATGREHLVQLAGQPVGVAGEVQLRAGLVRAGRRLRAEPVEPGDRQRLQDERQRDQGALLPVELIWQPKVGAEQLPGEYRLGYYSTAKADDVYDDVDGQPQADRQRLQVARQQAWLVGGGAAAGHFAQRRCLARVEPVRQPDGPRQGDQRGGQLPAARGGLQGSVRCAAEGRHRPGHRIHVNDDVKKRQRLVNQVNGIDDYDNPLYQPLQDTEYNAELYYGVHVTDWLTVRPNLQYIKQPGGVDEVDNALVARIKIQTVF